MNLKIDSSVSAKLIRLASFGVAAILVLVPFHALLSVWVGSFFGAYDAARLWKEALLVLLVGLAGYFVWRDQSLWRKLRSWPLLWLIVAYCGLEVGMGLVALATDHVGLKALGYGLIVDLRFLIFFLVALVVATRSSWLRQHWQKLALVSAAVVVVFGLLQAFVLPNDFLTHFGYGPDTIKAYQMVDQDPEHIRIQSTLRGANPLGAYLVVVLGVVVALLVWGKKGLRSRRVLGGLLVASLMVLGLTYSRSAYIGAAAAIAVTVWLAVESAKIRRFMIIGAACLLVLFTSSVWLLRDNDAVQSVLFHTNEHSSSPRSSNQDRTSALQSGLRDVATEPLGRGPGTAGPASVYNTKAPARIAENYYLQIGQAVGWVGLGLFVAIVVVLCRQLLRIKHSPLALALVASLVGISIINLLSHAWTDDTLSLLWWGFAGIAILPAIIKPS